MTRPSPSSLLLRLIVLATGASGLTIALPARLLGPAAIVVVVLAAAVPVVIPGRWPALALELIAALLWPASSFGAIPGGPETGGALGPDGALDNDGGLGLGGALGLGAVSNVAMLALLAALLYIHHTSCALAAAMSWDTIVTPPVFVRWLAQAGIAIAPAVVLAAVGVVLPGRLHDSAPILIPILGIGFAVATIAFIVRAVRPNR